MAINSKIISNANPIAWSGTVIISLIIGYFVLKPFLAITVLGLLLAFVFYPMYTALKKRFKSGMAVALTTLASVFIIAIPLTIVLTVAVSQAFSLAADISNSELITGGENFTSNIEELADKTNEKIESWFGIKDAIADEDVSSFLQKTIPAMARAAGDIVIGIVSGIPNFFTLLIVYFFVFTAGLSYGKKLRQTAEVLSPFDAKTNKLYMDRMGAMAKAMIKGQMLIALAQGVVSALVLSMVGFSSYFFILALLFTFMSFIPLGAGIITIPLGIALVVFGNITGGLLVLLNHFIIVTNIDNYIRPKVVPEEARLPAVLIILGAFGGVSLFGLIGVVYGPMLMIFITTTIDSYAQYKSGLHK